jgi:hypothetical protein
MLFVVAASYAKENILEWIAQKEICSNRFILCWRDILHALLVLFCVKSIRNVFIMCKYRFVVERNEYGKLVIFIYKENNERI